MQTLSAKKYCRPGNLPLLKNASSPKSTFWIVDFFIFAKMFFKIVKEKSWFLSHTLMFCFCSTIEDIFQSFCIFYWQQRISPELPILDPGSTFHANTLIVLRSLITDQCGEWGVVSGYYALISTVWRVKVKGIFDMRCVFQISRWRFYCKGECSNLFLEKWPIEWRSLRVLVDQEIKTYSKKSSSDQMLKINILQTSVTKNINQIFSFILKQGINK